MMRLSDQIQHFYSQLYNIHNNEYWELWDANAPLRDFFRDHLKVTNDKDAKKELLRKNKAYLSQHRSTIDNQRNIYNLYQTPTTIQAQEEELDYSLSANLNQVNEPYRQTLLRIAFSLEMTSKDCNKMLAAAGQYALHKGGNARESIYYYCLEEGRSLADAEDLYQKFLGLSPSTESVQQQTSPSLSQRTKINTNKIDTFLEEHHQDEQAQKGLAFVTFLKSIAHTFTESSGRAWRLVDNMHKKITAEDFLDFWGSALIDYMDTYVDKKLRSYVRHARSVPSRDYICLLATAVYYKGEVHNQLLLDFVNERLLGCGLGPLMKYQHPDSLIIELSRYDVGSCKKNTIIYTDESNTPQQLLLSNVSNKSAFDVAQYIVEAYTGGKYYLVQPLRNMCLMEADAFFEKERKKKN